MKSDLEIFDFELSEDEMRQLDEAPSVEGSFGDLTCKHVAMDTFYFPDWVPPGL